MDFNFFPISWNCHENTIRVYGMREGFNKPICIQVSKYYSTAVVELDSKYFWTLDMVNQLMAGLKKAMYGIEPSSCERKKSRLLYGAHVAPDGSPKLFEFLFLKFEMPKSAHLCEYLLKNGIKTSFDFIKLKTHLTGIPLWFQLVLENKLPVSDWLCIRRAEQQIKSRQVTICAEEYNVDPTNICALKNPPLPPQVPIMAYDIETFSSTAAMCNPDVADDKIFQISMVIGNNIFLITRGLVNIDDLKKQHPTFEVKVIEVKSETELIEKFVCVILNCQPLIITGYNNMGFDGTYIITRAKNYANCWTAIESLTYCPIVKAIEKEVAWSSAARPDQKFNYMHGEGIVTIDMMTLIRQDYGSKLNDFKLQSVAQFFLQDSKNDMTPAQMHFIMKKVMENPTNEWCRNQLTLVGAYCIKDSLLVIELMQKLETMYSLFAMATVCNCKIEDLCVRGQQNKVMSLILKFCNDDNIVVDKIGKSGSKNESYRGATVFDPIVGLHENIVSFDFTSLYPSLIIANNLCASTLVDVNDKTIPEDKCKVMEWEDHVKCDHDEKWVEKLRVNKLALECKKIAFTVGDKKSWQQYIDVLIQQDKLAHYKPSSTFCIKRKFKWYHGYPGIYPRILEMLMSERVKTRKLLKEKVLFRKTLVEGTPEAKQCDREAAALDKKQLALKLVCNSLYGFTGSSTSPIPCVPIAMCTTYSGRTVIQQASEIIQTKFNGIRVYGDSVAADTPVLLKDSNGVVFIKTIDEISNAWIEYPGFKCDGEIRNNKQQALTDLQVWSYDCWTPIKRVIRHQVAKQMYRIVTHTGMVDVTEDHSLLRFDGSKVKPNSLKCGDELLHGFPELNHSDNSLSMDECWIMGLFFADGSACIVPGKTSWNISKQDLSLLEKCLEKLSNVYPDDNFKIYKSSKVYKLTCSNSKRLGTRYRSLFYSANKYKIVPDLILNASIENKRAFCSGYYEGDGAKHSNNLYFCVKGKIGAQGLFALHKSLGYNLSVNCRTDKPNIFTIRSCMNYDKHPYQIKKIIPLGIAVDYVYDLEANGKFNAGIGCLTVANTDSNYVKFEGHNEYAPLYEFAKKVASYVSAQFHKSINIEFEDEVYAKWFISNKKQYCSASLNSDNTISKKLKAKGMCLVRRDNCEWVRKIVTQVIWLIFGKTNVENIIDYVFDQCLQLCYRQVDLSALTTSKTVGSFGDGSTSTTDEGKTKVGKYIVTKLPIDDVLRNEVLSKAGYSDEKMYYRSKLPAHVQLAIRMNERGTLVVPGERLAYVVADVKSYGEKMSNKLESVKWFKHNAQYFSIDFSIDFLHYIEMLMNVIDTLIKIQYPKTYNIVECPTNCVKCKKDKKCTSCKKLINYMDKQLRSGRCEAILRQFVFKNKLNQELLNLFRPKIV